MFWKSVTTDGLLAPMLARVTSVPSLETTQNWREISLRKIDDATNITLSRVHLTPFFAI
jgi:hypothetical protein